MTDHGFLQSIPDTFYLPVDEEHELTSDCFGTRGIAKVVAVRKSAWFDLWISPAEVFEFIHANFKR